MTVALTSAANYNEQSQLGSCDGINHSPIKFLRFQSSMCSILKGNQTEKAKETHRILPAVLGVDIGTELKKALGDIDPPMKRGDMERGSVIVVMSIDKARVLLKELPDGGSVILVGMPENQRRPANPSFLLLLARRRCLRGGATAQFLTAGSLIPLLPTHLDSAMVCGELLLSIWIPDDACWRKASPFFFEVSTGSH